MGSVDSPAPSAFPANRILDIIVFHCNLTNYYEVNGLKSGLKSFSPRGQMSNVGLTELIPGCWVARAFPEGLR